MLRRSPLVIAWVSWVSSLLWGAPAAAEPPPTDNYLGMNIGTIEDYSNPELFADAMAQARYCNKPGTATAARTDADGWPVEDADCLLWARDVSLKYASDRSGTYAVRLESDTPVTVTFAWSNNVFSGLSRNAATKISTGTLVVTDSPAWGLSMALRGVPSTGVRNIRVMRPVTPGATLSHALTENFSRDFKRAVAPFSALRWSGYTNVNGNTSRVWSDAPTFTQRSKVGSRGGAWEYVILGSNELQKDAWITVPLQADDAYVRQLALLFRDGNAFTNGRGLDPNLKLYVEFSNEVWNGTFPEAAVNLAAAKTEKQAGDPYGYSADGNQNQYYWGYRRTARRAADISLIFRSVFGDARMMTQVRPIFAWQIGNGATSADPLTYIQDIYIPRFAAGRRVRDLFYGGGGTAYYDPGTGYDIASFWTSGTMSTKPWVDQFIKNDARTSAAFGLKFIAYEGGPGLYFTNAAENSIKDLMWGRPEMTTSVLDHHRAWSETGGDLLMYFVLAEGTIQWDFVHQVNQLNTAKYRAVTRLSGAPRAPLQGFKSVPSVTAGNQFDYRYTTFPEPALTVTPSPGPERIDVLGLGSNPNTWRAYTYQTAAAGCYYLALNFDNPSRDTVIVYADGVELLRTQNTTNTSIQRSLLWGAGTHSVMVKVIGPAGTTVLLRQVALSSC